MYKEVTEALSNYDKSNFWWFGVTGLKKTRAEYLADLFETRGEKGKCDLVCLEHF